VIEAFITLPLVFLAEENHLSAMSPGEQWVLSEDQGPASEYVTTINHFIGHYFHFIFY